MLSTTALKWSWSLFCTKPSRLQYPEGPPDRICTGTNLMSVPHLYPRWNACQGARWASSLSPCQKWPILLKWQHCCNFKQCCRGLVWWLGTGLWSLPDQWQGGPGTATTIAAFYLANCPTSRKIYVGNFKVFPNTNDTSKWPITCTLIGLKFILSRSHFAEKFLFLVGPQDTLLH